METLHRTIYYQTHGGLQGLPPGLSCYCRTTPRPAPGCCSDTALHVLYYIQVFAQPEPPSRDQHSILLQIAPPTLQLPAGHLTPVLSYCILFSYGRLCRPQPLHSPRALVCWDKDSVLSGCLGCLDSADQVRSLQFLLTGRKSGLIFFLHLSSSEMS